MDMVSANGPPPADLISQLLANGYEFDFFQAVRLLEQAAKEHPRLRTQELGEATSPKLEPVRFRAQASLSFAAGDISVVSNGKSRRQQREEIEKSETPNFPIEVTVPFMGLTGPNGALPDHYTALVIERSHQKTKDHSLREFFDLFNHRAITLFYLAWRKHRICEEFLRMQSLGRDGEDRFTSALFSVTGFGTPALKERHSCSDEFFLFYGGFFANVRRSATGLSQILQNFLKSAVQIEQFQGRWLYLPEDVQSSFPDRNEPRGRNLSLGVNAVCGSRAWDRQSLFRVVLGPLDRATFLRYLPGSEALRTIEEIVRTYAGPHFDFEIQLILKAADVPQCQLSGSSSGRPLLGWTTWLGKSMIPVDSGDAVFRFSGLSNSEN